MTKQTVKIMILDADEVWITPEEAERINEHGDTATYRWTRDELMNIIGRQELWSSSPSYSRCSRFGVGIAVARGSKRSRHSVCICYGAQSINKGRQQEMTRTSWRTVPLPPNWGQIRAAVIARDPVCRWGSLEDDKAEPDRCPNRSTDADHIGEPWDHRLEALRGLCWNHHATRTGRQGAAGTARVARSRKRPKEPHPGYRRP